MNTPVIHVNIDDPREGVEGGRPSFMPHGSNTDFLNSVLNVLNGVEQGSQITRCSAKQTK